MIFTIKDFRRWRAAARARGRTPNVAQLGAQMQQDVRNREPWRSVSLADIYSTDPVQRQKAERKYGRVLAQLKRSDLVAEAFRALRHLAVAIDSMRAERHRLRSRRWGR